MTAIIGTAATLLTVGLAVIEVGRRAGAYHRGDRRGRPSRRRWAVLDRVAAPDVNHPERDHMVRYWLVETPWCGVAVHRINTPDDTRPIPHNHPWPFLSVILRGGYDEEIERHYRRRRMVKWDRRTRRAGTVHLVRTIDAHTITALRRSPTWTLVLVGRRRAEPSWGYWDGSRFIPWDEHPYAQAFAAALHARNATTTSDRPPVGDVSRPAQPRPVDTARCLEDMPTRRRDDS